MHAFWNKFNPYCKKQGKNSKWTNRKGQTKKDTFDISDVDRGLLAAFYSMCPVESLTVFCRRNSINCTKE